MRVPLAPARAELVVSRSRFLALLLPVSTTEAARDLLRGLKTQYADASHVVHAFCLGDSASRTTGSSDDGEPSGTAGRPVLDVLVGSGGSNAFVAVVRWFGGTLLGTGGLVHAYGDAARAVLAATSWKELRDLVEVGTVVAYDQLRAVRSLLQGLEAEDVVEEFAAEIAVRARVPRASLGELQRQTRDATRGRSQWQVVEG